MKPKLSCPWCSDDSLAKMLKRAPRLRPGWMLPCPNCLEFARVTPEHKLRKATREERLMMMTEAREVVERFATLAKEYRSERDEWMRRQE